MVHFLRIAFAFPLAFVLMSGCHVYDETLLDGARSEDGADGTFTDGSNGPDSTVDGDVVTADRADAPDVLRTCTTILASGHACIEPFAGHGFSADDPRLIAPAALGLTADTPPRVAVSDLATGRIMSYANDGTGAQRLGGTGTLAISLSDGVGTSVPFSAPSAMTYLTSGDLLIADSVAHGLFVRNHTTGHIAPFGGQVYQDGPWAVSLLDVSTLLVAADNQIYSVTIGASAPGAPTPLVGQSCGSNCPGFNASTAAGLLTSLNFPTGVDALGGDNFIYIADSQNCRIRRASLNSNPPYQTTVFAGGGGPAATNGCDLIGSAYGSGGGTSVPAAMAHLGPVGDVKVGFDGTVYFTDPVARCAIMAVASSGASAGMLRVVIGDPTQCGHPDSNGIALGRLGSLGLSEDRTQLFFVDQENQRIGHAQLGVGGLNGAPSFTISPGATPATGATADQVRVGGVSGLGATGTTDSPSLFWSGGIEGRVYQLNQGTVTTFGGTGYEQLRVAFPANRLEPSFINGLSVSGTTVAMALTSHSVVSVAMSTSLFPSAGTYNSPGQPALTVSPQTDLLDSPSWPMVHGTSLFFSTKGPGARIFRTDDLTGRGTAPLAVIAGTAPGVDGGVPTGDGGSPATTVPLGQPAGIDFDTSNNLYIADTSNHVIWRVSNGNITIIAGVYGQVTPIDDQENDARGVAIPAPTALAFDGAHTLYISDPVQQRIRALNLTNNRIVTVAGGGTTPGDFNDALQTQLGHVTAIAFLSDRLFFGEFDSGRVRVLRFAH